MLIDEIERDLQKLAEEKGMKNVFGCTMSEAKIVPNTSKNEPMKKSEKYYAAMMCVLDSNMFNEHKLDILEQLMDDRKTALFVEQREEEDKA